VGPFGVSGRGETSELHQARPIPYLESVNSLASFALYAAFPRSDYYDTSDAHGRHRETASLNILS
jgi:hypothetical protein